MQHLVVHQVVQHRIRHAVVVGRHEHRGAGHAHRFGDQQRIDEHVQFDGLAAGTILEQLAATLPGAHDQENKTAGRQREPPAVGDFQDIG